jgi:hypothetical protein
MRRAAGGRRRSGVPRLPRLCGAVTRARRHFAWSFRAHSCFVDELRSRGASPTVTARRNLRAQSGAKFSHQTVWGKDSNAAITSRKTTGASNRAVRGSVGDAVCVRELGTCYIGQIDGSKRKPIFRAVLATPSRNQTWATTKRLVEVVCRGETLYKLMVTQVFESGIC